MTKRDEDFYDRVYEEWRRGHNPDDINEDRWDDLQAQGFYPDEISVDMLCPHHPQESE